MTYNDEFKKFKAYFPEPIIMFITVFLFNRLGELVWTLSKDRQNKKDPTKNIWVPPGGETELLKKAKQYDLLDFRAEALREVQEEVGVKACFLSVLHRFDPFNVEFVYNAYPNYESTIINTAKGKTVKRIGAHALILQVEAHTKGRPRPMRERGEPNSETVEIKELSTEESLQLICSGRLKTHNAVKKGLEIIHEERRARFLRLQIT